MSKITNSASPASCRNNNTDRQNHSFVLAKAIEEVEDYFLNEAEGRLYRCLLNIIEKPLIENILRRTEGNQLRAAKILGINRNTLHAKIKKLKINLRDSKGFK